MFFFLKQFSANVSVKSSCDLSICGPTSYSTDWTKVAIAVTNNISSSSSGQLQSITPFIIYQSPRGQHGQLTWLDAAHGSPDHACRRQTQVRPQGHSFSDICVRHCHCRQQPVNPTPSKKSNPDVLHRRNFELGLHSVTLQILQSPNVYVH